MQEKPSNPVDPDRTPDPFPVDSGSGEPQDFLGLGASGDAAIDPALEGPTTIDPTQGGDAPPLAEEMTQKLQELTAIDDQDASWLQEVEEGEPDPTGQEEDWDQEEDGEETMSWLMELDVEDEHLLATDPQPGETSAEEGGEVVTSGAGPGKLDLFLYIVISVGAGFGAARYITTRGDSPDTAPPPPPPGVEQPAAETVAQAPVEPAPVPPPADAVVDLGPLPAGPLFDGPWRPARPAPEVIEAPAPVVVAETVPEPVPETTPETTPEPAVVAAAEPEPPVPAEPTPAVDPGGAVEPEGPRRAPLFRNPFRTLAIGGPSSGPDGGTSSPFLVATRTPSVDSPVVTPEPEVAIAEGPNPTMAATDGTDGVEAGRERRTQVVKVEDMTVLPEEMGDRIREASASELSGIWSGGAIPIDAIEGQSRLLTPSIGRVRVHLGSGEIFEGQLYAVGQKKVWLETELGKMALLSWQVHRIEHILTTEGVAALGDDGSQDLAGLEQVRVRTPGGVFYGKVIDRDEDTVTLVTDEGARITLRDAVVDPAGKSATRLVDSSGAEEDPEEGTESSD